MENLVKKRSRKWAALDKLAAHILISLTVEPHFEIVEDQLPRADARRLRALPLAEEKNNP